MPATSRGGRHPHCCRTRKIADQLPVDSHAALDRRDHFAAVPHPATTTSIAAFSFETRQHPTLENARPSRTGGRCNASTRERRTDFSRYSKSLTCSSNKCCGQCRITCRAYVFQRPTRKATTLHSFTLLWLLPLQGESSRLFHPGVTSRVSAGTTTDFVAILKKFLATLSQRNEIVQNFYIPSAHFTGFPLQRGRSQGESGKDSQQISGGDGYVPWWGLDVANGFCSKEFPSAFKSWRPGSSAQDWKFRWLCEWPDYPNQPNPPMGGPTRSTSAATRSCGTYTTSTRSQPLTFSSVER